MTTVCYDLLFYIQLRKMIGRLQKYLAGAISVVSDLLGLSLTLITGMKGKGCAVASPQARTGV